MGIIVREIKEKVERRTHIKAIFNGKYRGRISSGILRPGVGKTFKMEIYEGYLSLLINEKEHPDHINETVYEAIQADIANQAIFKQIKVVSKDDKLEYDGFILNLRGTKLSEVEIKDIQNNGSTTFGSISATVHAYISDKVTRIKRIEIPSCDTCGKEKRLCRCPKPRRKRTPFIVKWPTFDWSVFDLPSFKWPRFNFPKINWPKINWHPSILRFFTFLGNLFTWIPRFPATTSPILIVIGIVSLLLGLANSSKGSFSYDSSFYSRLPVAILLITIGVVIYISKKFKNRPTQTSSSVSPLITFLLSALVALFVIIGSINDFLDSRYTPSTNPKRTLPRVKKAPFPIDSIKIDTVQIDTIKPEQIFDPSAIIESTDGTEWIIDTPVLEEIYMEPYFNKLLKSQSFLDL